MKYNFIGIVAVFSAVGGIVLAAKPGHYELGIAFLLYSITMALLAVAQELRNRKCP